MADVPENTGEQRADHATRFQPGNPGRPKGARHKLGGLFLEKLLADFTEHGPDVIAEVREEKPDQYLKVVASILPKEIEPGDELANVLQGILDRVDGKTRNIVPTFEIV